jgi:hypothetical protein
MKVEMSTDDLRVEYATSTLVEMAARRGCSWQTMQALLVRRGISLRKRGGGPRVEGARPVRGISRRRVRRHAGMVAETATYGVDVYVCGSQRVRPFFVDQGGRVCPYCDLRVSVVVVNGETLTLTEPQLESPVIAEEPAVG